MTREEQLRKELENLCAGYASAISGSLRELVAERAPSYAGKKVGFVFLLFDFGDEGSFAYASNGQRADVVKLLQEAREKIARRTQ